VIEDDRHDSQVLEGIYHKGQAQAWDGKELLGQLVVKHGGVHHLPTLVHQMGPAALIDTAAWQLRMLMLEVDGLGEMGQHFRELGIDVNRLYDEAEKRQLRALEELSAELGWSSSIWEPVRKVVGFKRAWSTRGQ